MRVPTSNCYQTDIETIWAFNGMQLKRFHGYGINGYLNLDLDFFEDLTFLTGINGTGKTSALNAIASLLMPRLDYLGSQTFEKLSLIIENDGETVILSAVQHELDTVVSCSKFPGEDIVFEPFDDPMDYPDYKSAEMEQRYYKELQERHSRHPVMEFILGLPTPMFLGLDRRSRSFEIEPRMNRAVGRRNLKRKKNVFGSSLSGSLSEALYFAERRIWEINRRKVSLDRKFRDNLIDELLNFPPIDFRALITDAELVEPKKLREARKNVYKIPELLQVSGEEITSRLGKLFEFIEENMVIARQSRSSEVEDDEPWNDENFEARLVLAHNKANIDKINALSRMVSQYTANLRNMFSRVDEFVALVNSFIHDSNKTLEYDESGSLSFRVGEEHVERDLRTLSSGEIQLIVIFAHLYFNPETERANVFIIDEPELSLHVQWQAKFVDALITASRDTQFVMATHSPTVIMNRVDHCEEIVSKL